MGHVGLHLVRASIKSMRRRAAVSQLKFSVKMNGIETVHASINDGDLFLKVTFTDGKTFSPTQDGLPIQPDKSDKILKALDALKELLNKHGIARRRG